jgi:hypothetical protein
LIPEPRRCHPKVLDYVNLRTEEAPRVMPRHEANGLLDALDLAITPTNVLAVGWSFARGEFDGLRVERPVRMAAQGASTWL